MGVTIFYKGKLKEQYTPKDVFEIAKECLRISNWKYSISSKKMSIKIDKESEELVLYFKDAIIDEFCKISSTASVNFDIIYDMFYNMASLFETLEISDDINIADRYWEERNRTGHKYIMNTNMTDEEAVAYFKKGQPKRTLKKAFKEIFKSPMGEYGFRYCSKLDAFIRLVNEEVIQYICIEGLFNNTPSSEYRLRIGMFSIYANDLFDKHRLVCLSEIHIVKKINKTNGQTLYQKSKWYNEGNIDEKLTESVEEIGKYWMPMLNNVDSIEKYYEYMKSKNYGMFCHVDQVRNTDAYVMLKLHDMGDYKEVIVKKYNSNDQNQLQIEENIRKDILEPRDRVFNDKELYDEAIKEMERRKEYNLAMLKKLKVIE